MNRIIIALLSICLFSFLKAQDERSRVQEEILNSLAEAEKARAEAIQACRKR